MNLWRRIARATVGDDYAARYADRFRELAARGEDVHGEASLVTRLAPPPARVLDAGCGTGRVAVRLAELGYEVVGVDVDAAMLDQARLDAPHLDWHEADLADLDLGTAFDVVLLAGNTIPLLDPGSLEATVRSMAIHLEQGGLLVAGFGLDEAHLPPGCPVVPLAEVDAALTAAGLALVERWSSWDRAPVDDGEGYVVTVHTWAAELR